MLGALAGAVVVLAPAAHVAAGTGVMSQTIAAPSDATDYRFGFAVAVSSDGTIALIGAPGSNPPTAEAGKAYVFTRQNGGPWTEQAELTPSPSTANDFFGGAVALSRDGRTAIVGASGTYISAATPGSAFIFTQNAGVWTQRAHLTGDTSGDFFGFSVALDWGGSTAAVGAPSDNTDEGAAYLFADPAGTWTQQAKLTDPGRTPMPPTPGDNFGFSLGLGLTSSGQEVLIGADQGGTAGNSAVGQGFADTYLHSAGVWGPTPLQQLTASDAAPGDAFGNSVAITGNGHQAVIGAEGKNGFAGAAYTFGAPKNMFAQKQELTGSDSSSGDLFGYNVTLDDNADIAEISAPFADGFNGNVYRFAGKIGGWSQVLEQSGAGTPGDYGIGLALNHNGSVELVGADGEDTSASDGAVYAYEFS